MAGFPAIMKNAWQVFLPFMNGQFSCYYPAMKTRRYQMPTHRQILWQWPLKPLAKVVALLIEDTARERVGDELSDKEYGKMSQQERDECNREARRAAKVWFSVRQLAEKANASRDGVDSALDELQKKKVVQSDRRKGPKHRGNNRYCFRLIQPTIKPSKKSPTGAP
jgi:hypothetical protein